MHILGLVLLPARLKERKTNTSHRRRWMLAGLRPRRQKEASGPQQLWTRSQEPRAWGAPSALSQLCYLSHLSWPQFPQGMPDV